MPKDKKRPEPKVAEQLFSHHLAYEVDMLRWLYPDLHSGKNPQHVHNALVEAFHMHARNIHEFFTLNSNCSIDPRWFTSGFEVNMDFMDDELVRKINQQISHLTAKRVIGVGQLDAPHWKKIKDSIEAEIARFEAAMTPEYKSKWKFKNPTSIRAGVGTGASSQPNSLGSKSPATSADTSKRE